MANNTIYPYGPGGQLPSGIAIINDLITGGADKALSAEMGKTLAEMIGTTGLQSAEVSQDGLYFVDAYLNVGASIVPDGLHAINILEFKDAD